MEFFINGFLATFGALAAICALWFFWSFGAYVIAAILPKVLPKRMQAEFIRDLKKDPWRNAGVIAYCHKVGWYEGDVE